MNSRLLDLKLHAIIDKLSPKLRYKLSTDGEIKDFGFSIWNQSLQILFSYVIFLIIFIDLVNIRHIKSDMADIFRNSF